ncbi:hypothetical protein [Reyranella sp.]|uniref:hypothetical protein n=1 Tax=Reyranella sp. TaxID=1929291 RepID=UPI003D134261
MQAVLEYVHAIWTTHAGPYPSGSVDTTKANHLIELCDELITKSMLQAMASSLASTEAAFGSASKDVEVQAKHTWILIRGHRYQVLEEEFFRFALSPHEAALKTAYGIGASEIATGIQSIADSFRIGYGRAVEVFGRQFERYQDFIEDERLEPGAAIARLGSENPSFADTMAAAWDDMIQGGICNLSRHTALPEPLLRDLAYDLGGEAKFFAPGEFVGTPYRALPARVKPLVKLDDGYYATDGQFVRDTAYRAIQWGLLSRVPSYRQSWTQNQKTQVENAFPEVLSSQLRDAQLFREVYFKDASTGQWVETDLVGVVDDTLFVVEAKAGVMAMHSPATSFDVHVRTIRNLVVSAYEQCRRFLEYLASAPEVPLFALRSGKHVEVARLRKASFRKLLPLGLTIESFSPFSAMCKELPQIQPILGMHPFISLSVDDIFVLKRLLPTTGILFHYLEVRQAVAGLPLARMFDEMDHLGAYIQKNRFDQDMRQQLASHIMVMWDSFSHTIDRHFEREDWHNAPIPAQPFPANFLKLLDALDLSRPPGWLRIDSALRDFGDEGRKNVARQLRALEETLPQTGMRRFSVGEGTPLQIWLSRELARPTAAEIKRQGEIVSLAFQSPETMVVVLDYDTDGNIRGTRCSLVPSPPIVRADYAELQAEAGRQKSRVVDLRKDNPSL